MRNHIKDPHTTIFTDLRGCGKSHLVLDLIQKEYNKHYEYIIIICPALRWNKTYAKGWIRHNNNVWLTVPKVKLYEYIEKLSLLLARSEPLLIIDDINADENLDK